MALHKATRAAACSPLFQRVVPSRNAYPLHPFSVSLSLSLFPHCCKRYRPAVADRKCHKGGSHCSMLSSLFDILSPVSRRSRVTSVLQVSEESFRANTHHTHPHAPFRPISSSRAHAHPPPALQEAGTLWTRVEFRISKIVTHTQDTQHPACAFCVAGWCCPFLGAQATGPFQV